MPITMFIRLSCIWSKFRADYLFFIYFYSRPQFAGTEKKEEEEKKNGRNKLLFMEIGFCFVTVACFLL